MLADRLVLGERWTFVGGKGGVGKTTTAAALAVALADRGETVLALSTDPAHSLGDALGTHLGADPDPVPGVPGLRALEIDPAAEKEAFLASHREQILRLVERGTYLERDDVAGFLDLALPGIDELASLLRLLRLRDEAKGPVVVDTAPTGHTLRLLFLPRTLRSWLDALSSMEEKHRAVALGIAGAYRPDDAALFLNELGESLEALAAEWADPRATRFVLVTTPGEVVAAETGRLAATLREEGIALGGIVINRAERGAQSTGAEVPAEVPVCRVAALSPEPVGVEGARRFAAAACAVEPVAPGPIGGVDHAGPGWAGASGAASDPAAPGGTRTPGPAATSTTAASDPERSRDPERLPPAARTTDDHGTSAAVAPELVEVGEPYLPPLDRGMYWVGGKGGVGKSTVASALAVLLASEGREVLLLSTDPAGSVGDLFSVPLGGAELAAPGAPGLRLRQVTAEESWARFRDQYREEAERLFSGLARKGLSAEEDRQVVMRMVDLAPPGVDELVSILEVVDLTEDMGYNALVLDTAPTGHLLRLLEMPAAGLEWTHALLRLLLKYREVIGLGEIGERVLRLSRSLRALRERIENRDATAMLVVALPEALGVAETRRLLPRLVALGLAPEALVVNRLLGGEWPAEGRAAAAGALLALPGAGERVGAPDWPAGPRGAEELLRFARAWRRIGLPLGKELDG